MTARQRLAAFANISRVQSDQETYDMAVNRDVELKRQRVRAERAEAERDALRADAERAMRILMDAPGLPLEIADVDELVKWTDAIAAVLIVLSDYADAARKEGEG